MSNPLQHQRDKVILASAIVLVLMVGLTIVFEFTKLYTVDKISEGFIDPTFVSEFPFEITVPEESPQVGKWTVSESRGVTSVLLAPPPEHPYTEGASVKFNVAEYSEDPNDVEAILSWWESERPDLFIEQYRSPSSQELVDIADQRAIRIQYHAFEGNIRPNSVSETTVLAMNGFTVLARSWWNSPNEDKMLLQKEQARDIVSSIRAKR